ncbi:MAG: hypothetical protein GTO40_26595, partial [Deltaproteobacteria bacterium]|nr:hypothetical protein [Deltaproteobacteria bacterium]
VDLEGDTVDLLIKGDPENRETVDQLKNLAIESPSGQVRLGSVSEIFLEPGPVSISRFDGERSVTISGNIIAEDTQAVGWRIQSAIDSLDIPPGIE